MALKRKITKAEFDALDPLLQKEYKAEGADFVLDAEGFDDPAELRRAKAREAQRANDAEKTRDKLQADLDAITNTDAYRAGDIKTLEKSWQTKMDTAVNDLKAQLKRKDAFIEKVSLQGVARSLAAELGGDNAALLLPHIERRLTLDTTGDEPLTRVLDKEGKPSASSIEDLKKEMANDKQYAPLVIASKASGSGAAGGGQPGNGGAGTGQKKFQELSDKERTDWFKRDPDGFKAASAAAKQSARQ